MHQPPVAAQEQPPAWHTRNSPNRQKRQVSGFFDPAVGKQSKKLAADQDTTNQELLREALNDVFAKYALPPIA